jgi:hypothetical protein
MVFYSQNLYDNLLKIYQDNSLDIVAASYPSPGHLWVCLFFKCLHNLQAVRLSAVTVPIFIYRRLYLQTKSE